MSAGVAVAKPKDTGLWRDLSSYWILGLCNNFGYTVMLSAANDIIGQFSEAARIRSYGEAGTSRQCHNFSTGTILLADILPSLVVKMLMPCVPFCVNVRIAISIILSILSYLLVAFAKHIWVAFLGVVLTSASSGMGESTFVAYSSSYNKNVVSTWSSGTGAAGLLGSLSYAALIGIGCSPRDTLLMMIVIPVLEGFSFWILLRNPKDIPAISLDEFKEEEIADDMADLTFVEKVEYVWQLMKYMCPLMWVYYFEYLINQGMFELINFENIFLDQPAQYRWLQVDYQIGGFIARSSVNVIQLPEIWLMAVLQGLNTVYFIIEVIYYITPSIWITFMFVLWEGLIGGAAYVNTFYRMSKEITPNKRRFAIGIVIQADSFGILLAALTTWPFHNTICSMPLLERPTYEIW